MLPFNSLPNSKDWLPVHMFLFSEDISELKIQLETGCETERDLKTILEQTEGNLIPRGAS